MTTSATICLHHQLSTFLDIETVLVVMSSDASHQILKNIILSNAVSNYSTRRHYKVFNKAVHLRARFLEEVSLMYL